MVLGQSFKPSIGIAIFGLGRAGTIHFKNCLQNKRIDVKYLVDIDVEKARKYVADYKLRDTKAVSPTDIATVLGDPLVSGVIIATFATVHEDQVLQCIKAKKAVFCEKPLAATLEATENCYRAAEEYQVPLLCAFNRRFDPTLSKIRDGVLQGKVGQLQMVKTCSRDSPMPTPLGNQPSIFHDSTIHDIDLIMWIVCGKPETIYVQAHAFRKEFSDASDYDTVAVTMKFPSGVIAVIDQSRFAAYGYDQRLEAFGSAGMLQSKNPNATAICYSDARGLCDDVINYSFPQRYAASYENELDHFLDVIEGRAVLVTKQDVLAASRVAEACHDSCKSGQVVKLLWE